LEHRGTGLSRRSRQSAPMLARCRFHLNQRGRRTGAFALNQRYEQPSRATVALVL
jgi:hypothetical protein